MASNRFCHFEISFCKKTYKSNEISDKSNMVELHVMNYLFKFIVLFFRDSLTGEAGAQSDCSIGSVLQTYVIFPGVMWSSTL